MKTHLKTILSICSIMVLTLSCQDDELVTPQAKETTLSSSDEQQFKSSDGIILTNTGKLEVILKWSKVENADKYYVYEKVDQGSYQLVKKTTSNIYLPNVETSSPYKHIYSYKVAYLDGDIISEFSNTISAKGHDGSVLE